MHTGMKFTIVDWIRILNKMELGSRPNADQGFENLLRNIHSGYTLDHALWTEVNPSQESGFIFVVKNPQGEEQRCAVVYGPRSAAYMSAHATTHNLYFREKHSPSPEREWGREQDKYWTAGL